VPWAGGVPVACSPSGSPRPWSPRCPVMLPAGGCIHPDQYGRIDMDMGANFVSVRICWLWRLTTKRRHRRKETPSADNIPQPLRTGLLFVEQYYRWHTLLLRTHRCCWNDVVLAALAVNLHHGDCSPLVTHIAEDAGEGPQRDVEDNV